MEILPSLDSLVVIWKCRDLQSESNQSVRFILLDQGLYCTVWHERQLEVCPDSQFVGMLRGGSCLSWVAPDRLFIPLSARCPFGIWDPPSSLLSLLSSNSGKMAAYMCLWRNTKTSKDQWPIQAPL